MPFDPATGFIRYDGFSSGAGMGGYTQYRAQLQALGYPAATIDMMASAPNANSLIQNVVRNGLQYGSAGANNLLGEYGMTTGEIQRGAAAGPSPTTADVARFGTGALDGWNENARLPETPEYDPNAPDILEEQMDRYLEGLDPLAEEARKSAGIYSDGMRGLASGYGSAVRGSEGYTQLGNYADEMRALYDQGGLTDVTRAGLERNRRNEDQWIRAQREAMLADLAERGVSGGGYEIASSIGDRASAADRMSARDLDTQAFAQEQALGALDRSADAYDRIFGIDRDISGKQLEYGTAALENERSVSDMILDTAIGTWGDIERRGREQTYKAYDTAANNTLPAATTGAGILGDSATEGRNNAGEATARTGGYLSELPWNYADVLGSPPPTLNTNPTPAPVASGVPAAEGGTALAGGVYEGIAQLFQGDDEEEGSGGSGGSSGGSSGGGGWFS